MTNLKFCITNQLCWPCGLGIQSCNGWLNGRNAQHMSGVRQGLGWVSLAGWDPVQGAEWRARILRRRRCSSTSPQPTLRSQIQSCNQWSCPGLAEPGGGLVSRQGVCPCALLHGGLPPTYGYRGVPHGVLHHSMLWITTWKLVFFLQIES